MAAVVNLPSNRPAGLQRRNTTTATLTIPSRTGHRRTLTDIFVDAGSSGFSDISVGNVKVLRLYDNLSTAVFIKDLTYRKDDVGFLGLLKSLFPDIPLFTTTQDESLTIARNSAPTELDAYFQDADSGDVTNRAIDGGSQGNKQLLIINLNNGSAVVGSGNMFFDTVDLPDGISPFVESSDIVAGARRIPPDQRLTLYAIAADLPIATASKVTRVHLLEGTTELFTSENNEGLFVDQTVKSELAFSLSPLQLFKLPTPYPLQNGALYSFKADATYDGTHQLAANSQKLFLICLWEKTVAAA